MGDLSEISKLAHSACTLFQQHGSPESGVTALDKAAKMLEATQPKQALELFKRAADIIMVSSHNHYIQTCSILHKYRYMYIDIYTHIKCKN